MAKPIEPTPPLEGEEAEMLLRELKVTCSPEESERRLHISRDFLAQVVKPQGWRQATFDDA